jgi:leucine-rich repeat and immunoglobulin-like domain-containing nogo receptor-interacting protein
LQTVAKFAFAGLPNITHINLAHNKIIKVEEYAFTGTANVYEIVLESNPMLTIKTNAFSGLTNVGRLLLPSGLRNIEHDAFAGLNGVGLLRLSFMDLVALHQYTFRGLSNVHVLSLQESDLGVICAGAFEGLVNVDNLRIINNKIDAIEELNLTQENSIKEFRLHGNHLLETPEPGTITLNGIRSLSVIDNHFPCGCHIHTLLESPLANGTYQHEDFLVKNFCISPLEVNGRRINEIDIYSIGRCHEHVTRENLEASSALLAATTSLGWVPALTALSFRKNFCFLLFVGLVIYAYCMKNALKFS